MNTSRHARSQSGLSLVELMIGISVGLIVTAAATGMMLSHLTDVRELSLETQVQQDLRSSAELMVSELRRASRWGLPENGIWVPGSTSDAGLNPYGTITLSKSPAGVTAADQIDFTRSAANRVWDPAHPPTGTSAEDGVVQTSEQRGFRLAAGALQIKLGSAGWQDVTDVSTVTIRSLSINETRFCLPTDEFAATYCPTGTAGCVTPPAARLIKWDITLQGFASSKPAVQRSISTSVTLRNGGTCP